MGLKSWFSKKLLPNWFFCISGVIRDDWSVMKYTVNSALSQYVKVLLQYIKSVLLGHWYPCFGLLVTSALGFKARVNLFACIFNYLIPQIHNWCNSCLPCIWSIHLYTHKHWWDSIRHCVRSDSLSHSGSACQSIPIEIIILKMEWYYITNELLCLMNNR